VSTANLRAEPSAYPASAASPRDTAHLSKGARYLKARLSGHLREVRALHVLDQDDVYDKPAFVSRWEHPEKPHAPNLLHLVEVGSDERSRPYALRALDWAREEIERSAKTNPAQLSIFDLLTRGES
jgi:hypothetical protein